MEVLSEEGYGRQIIVSLDSKALFFWEQIFYVS